MARYAKDHHDKTHEAIINAASGLIRSQGLDGTGITDVMKAVGLTHGGFYAHFPDKPSMLKAAVERAIDETPKTLARLVNIAKSRQDISYVVDGYLADLRVEEVSAGCPAAGFGSELHRQPEAIKAAFLKGASGAAAELGTYFSGGGTSKPEHAWGAYAMLFGALVLMRTTEDAGLRNEMRQCVAANLEKLAAK
jgi:TetR/AcrR family transcriptional regulator, transcriptional repressor for nem operon